jgi:hypothetical protein
VLEVDIGAAALEFPKEMRIPFSSGGSKYFNPTKNKRSTRPNKSTVVRPKD